MASRQRPATTPEGRESQLVAAAVDLAEQQILAGTASAQVITHYLKLGSSRERLEQARLENENRLMDAKIEGMKSAARIEELYEKALDSMRLYRGDSPMTERDEYDD
jgi:hypothetical protein